MNIALIGYGYWGPNLARNINILSETTLYGICELNSVKMERAKSVFGDKVKYADDYHVFINDKNVDAVAIATPTEYSFQIAMDAMDAGKHIFIEKPIATTVDRAEKINIKAEEKNLIVHCDHIMLYHPVIRYIKKMIENGELGDLLYIDVSRINLGPLRRDVNALMDLAVHDISVIDFLSNGQKAERLTAMGQTCFGKQEVLTFLTIKYQTFIAHIKSSWVSPVKERKTIIAGTKRMVVFDDVATDKLTIYDRGFDVQQTEEYGTYEYNIKLGDISIPHIEEEDALRNSIKHFVDCIDNHKQSLSGPQPALNVMMVLEEAMHQLKAE